MSTEPTGRQYDLEEKGAGWLVFAAIILGFSGILGVIDGITATSKSSFYNSSAHYVFSHLHTWGWIMIIAGGIAIFASFSILAGVQWARWFGVAIAALQAIAHLLSIQAYPFWSLCVFALDVLVIYGLVVYGRGRLDSFDW